MISYFSDNSVECDAAEREATLREKVPDLLLADEHVLLAYKDRGGKGRDSSTFTNHRILIKNKMGVTGKKTEYKSIPYNAIRAYSCETAGTIDSDVEAKVYASGVGKLKFGFCAGKVDIFKLSNLLNKMVLVGERAGAVVPGGAITTDPSASSSGAQKTSIWDLIGENNSQIDPKTVESVLQSNPKILLPDESVELAFKCGRDSFLLTSHRIILIDVHDFSGQRVSYSTILWPTVRAFSVETAGTFDRDTELRLFTNLPDEIRCVKGEPRRAMTRIDIDFRKGNADIYAIQRFFADKILGVDTVNPSTSAVSVTGQAANNKSGNVLSWLSDDMQMIDVDIIESQYRANPPLLQNCEKVEMAFKGRRDLLIFTSKRLISVDVQGLKGKKLEYMSVPWTTVAAFGVESAGSFMDNDAEMKLWTDFDDVFFLPEEGGEEAADTPPVPIPRYSLIEVEFKKDKVDLLAIHRYLSERCLRIEGKHKDADGYYVPNLRPFDMPVPKNVVAQTKPGALESILDWLGNDAHAVDPAEINARFHGEANMLQADEKAVLAYKSGRDTLIITNKRIFMIDVKGLSGSRIAYRSVPYSSLRAFSVESAGSWDRDTEFQFWIKCFWEDVVKQDLRKGKADIFAIQAYVAEQIIGSQDGRAVLQPGATVTKVEPISAFLDFLGDNAIATNPAEVEQKLKSSPVILQSDETIEQAYKTGRDLCLFTTKRFLSVNKEGITGKRVEFLSIPLRYCHAFAVQTAGLFLSEPKVEIYAGHAVLQDLSKSSSDVWAVHKILSNKIIYSQTNSN